MTDSRRSTTTSALALCTLFLMAFAMRGPVTSVGPAADVVLRDFGLSYQAFGVLNALPVLAFGFFSFPAVTLSERIGMHKTIAAALGLLLLGTLCRVTESMVLLFAGTVFVGAGIAFLNVLVPVLLKAQAPDKAARAMGLYTVVVGLSGTIGTWTSAPLAHLADSHIAVMAVWLAFIVPALCLWPRVKTDDAAKAAAADKGGMVRLIKTGAAWAVILTMGMQSLTVYTTCAWLPTALTERGFTTSAAGLAVAFFLFCSLPGSLWLDAIIRRLGSLKRTAVLMTVMFLAGIACWQAGGWWVWPGCFLAGIPQGGMFTFALIVMAMKSHGPVQMAQISAVSQGVGYLAAGLGPWIFSVLYTYSGFFAASLSLVAAVLVWGIAALSASGSARVFR